jgi:restriction endonuclease S subunit
MSGTTYPTVSDEDILDLETPLPPLEIQNKIAEEVKTKMEKSKQLQEEAKSILEGAKEKVERIILGGDE